MGIQERRSREREARKYAIVSAATELFTDRDYNTTSMQDIADRSELNIATLYYYFSSKEILYLAVLVRAIELILPELESVSSGNGDPLQRLQRISLTYCRFIEAHPEAQAIIHCLQSQTLAPANEEEQALVERAYTGTRHAMGTVARVIADGVDQGLLRDLDIRETTALFWAGLNGVIQMATNKGVFKEPLDGPLLDRWLDLLLGGLKATH
ncbi:MAG: TetR/AcrR family transcriptional regulator [Proteobacteria bacterium]|nr:TetR/AcrR family transcriptional regulator [Pseudomonadota bacterium]